MKKKSFVLLTLLSLLSCQVSAHTSTLMSGGFSFGLIHPFSGLDHTIAMLAVGILAQQLGQSWQWKLPLIFLIGILVGGIFGYQHVAFSYAEIGIALSVVSLGWFVVMPHQIPRIMLCLLTLVFAACHGHSHGHEMGHVQVVPYFLGFLLATMTLHGFGWTFARLCQHYLSAHWLKLSGLAMMVSGLWMVS